MKDPAQTQLLSHSEYQVWGMKEGYAHTPIICPNRWGWESISSAAGMSFQIDKGQIDGCAFLSSKSEQNTFFFPLLPQRRGCEKKVVLEQLLSQGVFCGLQSTVSHTGVTHFTSRVLFLFTVTQLKFSMSLQV